MEKQQRRRWQVKDTVFSPWQDLPGRYTAAEISGMHRQGCFAAATPVDDEHQRPHAEDSRSSQLSQD
jgi:hypothetical protein